MNYFFSSPLDAGLCKSCRSGMLGHVAQMRRKLRTKFQSDYSKKRKVPETDEQLEG